jgi:hypothetical protein
VGSGIERVHAGEEDVNGFFDFESMLDMYWPAKDFFANETVSAPRVRGTCEKRQFLFKTFRIPGGQTLFSMLSWPPVFVFFVGTCIDQLKDFFANETCEPCEKRQFLFKTFRMFSVFSWPPAFVARGV